MFIQSARPAGIAGHTLKVLSPETPTPAPGPLVATAPPLVLTPEMARYLADCIRQNPGALAVAEPVAPRPSDLSQITTAGVKLAVTGLSAGVATGAWSMSKLGAGSAPQVAQLLASNHVPQGQAEALAKQFVAAVQDPLVKGALLAVSAGAASLVLLERTDIPWPRRLAYAAAVSALVALSLWGAHAQGWFA